MTQVLLQPAIWLIVLIVGLPQLSETVYSPALPDIAKALKALESMVEHTLTIFLFGFALGTLFWGKLSDHIGRKPCVLIGLLVFIIGSAGCYLSASIEMLMISRFIQAFGGSIGSVVGQAICRDAFHGPALGRVYSSAGSALAVFPAVGPVVGGLIAQYFGWPAIFLFLIIFAIVLAFFVMARLPETHLAENRKPISLIQVGLSLLKDKKVMGLGLIVAACNGIAFSYFAEGSFYLIKLLGLSPSQYGSSFVLIAAATMLGGMVSRRLHSSHSSKEIMGFGLGIIFVSTFIFSGFALFGPKLLGISALAMIAVTIASQMLTMFGVCMATSNALALSLADYKWCIGTASSLFGFYYYCLISLFTFAMGVLHNGTLFPMPLYFLSISVFMLLINSFMIRR